MPDDFLYKANVEFRNLKIADNLRDAARLIYQTDRFIYPALFGNVQIAEIVLPEIIKRGNTSFAENSLFAAIADGRIIGLICYIKDDFKWDAKYVSDIFAGNNISIPKYFFKASNEYFEKIKEMAVHNDCIYILNICVSENMRNERIGTKLLNAFIDIYRHNRLALHVLSDNSPAIHLYEKCGFAIAEKTKGFSPDSQPPDCFCMIKPADKH